MSCCFNPQQACALCFNEQLEARNQQLIEDAQTPTEQEAEDKQTEDTISEDDAVENESDAQNDELEGMMMLITVI